MTAWIKALRLPISILAGLLTVVSFKLVGLTSRSWLPALAVVAIACAHMVQNDWRDRFHDLKKGKDLAARHPRAFFVFTAIVWSIAAFLTLAVWRQDDRMGLIPACAMLVGFIHPETRRILLMPTTLGAITAASPVLFPVLVGNGSSAIWLLFVATAMVIFAREILKDLDDLSVDRGYKWTLPLKIGVDRSYTLVAALCLGSVVIAAMISASTLVGAPLIGASLLCDRKRAKLLLDLGMATVIGALFLTG